MMEPSGEDSFLEGRANSVVLDDALKCELNVSGIKDSAHI